MQNFFYSLFQKVKSSITRCERRNPNRVTLNPHAQRERTEIILKKTDNKPVIDFVQNPPIRYPSLGKFDQPKSQQINLLNQKPRNQQVPKIIVKPSTFTLNILEDDYQQKLQSPTLDEQLIKYHLTIDSYEHQLKKAETQIKFLKEKDQQRKKQFWKNVYINFANQKLDPSLSDIVDQDQQYNNQIRTENQLYDMYVKQIQNVRDFKYSKQIIDYPKISYSEYSHIHSLWVFAKKNPNHVIKNMKLKFLQKLIAKSFRTLSFGVWLNDQIINGYLQMIDNKAAQSGKKYKVLNSFFAKTTFSKSKQMISRALKRKNISEKNQIIIAINNGTHWFFARIINKKIIVYDSIPKDKCIYESNESTRQIFLNIIEFSNWFYGGQHEIQVEQGYPTQNNGSDCGMFLLCGIKDIVRDYRQWSFSQADIAYKRIQVAKELFDQEITGFYC